MSKFNGIIKFGVIIVVVVILLALAFSETDIPTDEPTNPTPIETKKSNYNNITKEELENKVKDLEIFPVTDDREDAEDVSNEGNTNASIDDIEPSKSITDTMKRVDEIYKNTEELDQRIDNIEKDIDKKVKKLEEYLIRIDDVMQSINDVLVEAGDFAVQQKDMLIDTLSHALDLFAEGEK